jgi:predicted carbohydrate-binding protein with CBM5 and CBM33 domain
VGDAAEDAGVAADTGAVDDTRLAAGTPPCRECGYDYDALARETLAAAVVAFAGRHAGVVVRTAPTDLRAHPLAGAWSALEYACHVRDVLRVQRERVDLACTTDEPAFALMRRDERAVEERYNEQDPAQVADELSAAGRAFADRLDALAPAEWARTGVYPWPEPRVRTVEWVARHTVHELQHHLVDLERLLGRPATDA